jgi:uncharacterized protein (DUF849 family)
MSEIIFDEQYHTHQTDCRTHLQSASKSLLTLVDLAEDYNTRELCLGVVGNLRVESEDAHAAAILGGNVLVGFLDQHCGGVDLISFNMACE